MGQPTTVSSSNYYYKHTSAELIEYMYVDTPHMYSTSIMEAQFKIQKKKRAHENKSLYLVVM
jgi:hypothetical protein